MSGATVDVNVRRMVATVIIWRVEGALPEVIQTFTNAAILEACDVRKDNRPPTGGGNDSGVGWEEPWGEARVVETQSTTDHLRELSLFCGGEQLSWIVVANGAKRFRRAEANEKGTTDFTAAAAAVPALKRHSGGGVESKLPFGAVLRWRIAVDGRRLLRNAPAGCCTCTFAVLQSRLGAAALGVGK